MAPNIFRGGESTPVIFLRPEENYIKLWKEQKNEGYYGTEADAQTHGNDL